MKKKTRKKKYRHIYPYICAGCGKRRLAFAFARAKKKECTNCEDKRYVDENQAQLFAEQPVQEFAGEREQHD